MKRCIVESYDSNFDADLRNDLTFFAFQRCENPKRLNKWIGLLTENPKILKRKYMCSRRFREKDFNPCSLKKKTMMSNGKPALTLPKQAIPFLNLSVGNKSKPDLPEIKIKTEPNHNRLENAVNIKVEMEDFTNQEAMSSNTKVNAKNSPLIPTSHIKEEVIVPETCKVENSSEAKEMISTESREIIHVKEEKVEGVKAKENSVEECLTCSQFKSKIAHLKDDETKVEEFRTLSYEFENHKESHVEKKFSCKECGKKFVWAKQVRKHMLLCHSSFICKVCDKPFTTHGKLKCHKRVKHNIYKIYNCESCDMAFFKVFDLLKHLKSHEVSSQCEKCKKKFSDKTALDNHKCVADKSQYQCDICWKVFKAETNVNNHKAKYHINGEIRKKIKKKSKKEETPGKFICDICKKSYKTSIMLSKHKLGHEVVHKCYICKKNCKDLRFLQAHILSHKGLDCYRLGKIVK